jgi:hypothetical protein
MWRQWARVQCTVLAAEPQLPDSRYGLQHDLGRHLGLPGTAFFEPDRHFGNAKASSMGAKRKLNLERVPGGVDRFEIQLLQHSSPKALETTRQIAVWKSEYQPRVERSTLADRLAHR